jgi:NAD(P)-dependent dehydrogenase (short-subunit alcohol dehydrogenase family)
LTDTNSETGAAMVAELRASGATAHFVRHDVSDEEQWQHVIEQARQLFGMLHIVVNNAGIVSLAPIDQMSVAAFDRLMAINVRGTFLGCKLVLPLMQAARGGSIINMSSITGVVANAGGLSAYSTSKGAVRLLTKAVAMDYVQYGIRVNSIHPGSIATPVFRKNCSRATRRLYPAANVYS